MTQILASPRDILLVGPGLSLMPGSGSGGGGSGGGSGGGGSGGSVVTLSNVGVLVIGQSNALFTFTPVASSGLADSDANYAGLAPITAAGIGFFAQTTGTIYAQGGSTLFSGNGLYPGPGALGTAGSWLVNPNTASGGGPAYYPAMMANPANFVDPSQWAWDTATGADGYNFLAYVAGLSSGQIASIQGLWVYWHESDSGRSYAEKATYKAALLRVISLIRTALGKTAAQLPVFDWGCMPSAGDDQGMCMVREVVYELAANSANNFTVVLPQAGDCNPRDNNGTPDSYHADNGDYTRWVHRACLPIVRAIYAAQGDTTSIPSSVGTGLGPQITAASISGNVVTVTVAHDIGTDFATFTSGAAAGTGWMLMDGGSISAGLPGNLIPALSAARVDATHIAITFAGIPVNAPGAVTLYYPYGNNRIGNPAAIQTPSNYAITDNASTVSRPSGWNAGTVLGDSAFNENMPLAMPMTVTGSGSSAVASCGMPLGTAAATLGNYGWNLQNYSVQNASSPFAPGAQVIPVVDDGSTLSPAYTRPASLAFGLTTNLDVLPSTWVSATEISGQPNLWSTYGLYVPSGAAAGTQYVIAQGYNSSGIPVSRLTVATITVT